MYQGAAAVADTREDFVARFPAMACRAEIRIAAMSDERARRAADMAICEVRRIESKYSRYRSDSVVSMINATAGSGEPAAVDDETAGLLDFAASMHALSGGRFDITSGVLRRAWNFRERRLPSQQDIAALRPLIGWSQVDWPRDGAHRHITLPKAGMELDFGGFGKEYAADRAAAALSAGGVESGYVNLGGDIRIIGPRPDGRAWSLGIQHPRKDATIAGVALPRGGLATSGDYERFIEIDGVRYCHILDPRTGWPVRYWQSMSVVAPICLAAGAMSTIAMLFGETAPEFMRQQGVSFLGVDARGQILRGGM